MAVANTRGLLEQQPVPGFWIRNALKHLAAEGRTVPVSSHLMSELAMTAEDLVAGVRGLLPVDRRAHDRLGWH